MCSFLLRANRIFYCSLSHSLVSLFPLSSFFFSKGLSLRGPSALPLQYFVNLLHFNNAVMKCVLCIRASGERKFMCYLHGVLACAEEYVHVYVFICILHVIHAI